MTGQINVAEEMDSIKLAKPILAQLMHDISRHAICNLVTDEAPEENDFSSLTTQEIIFKIRDHLKGEPSDVSSLVFLRYLAAYPVSICKRDVSPFLKKLISTHYKLGSLNLLDPARLMDKRGVDPVSYEELSEIFGRSKATINAYVNDSEETFRTLQSEVAKVLANEERQNKGTENE